MTLLRLRFSPTTESSLPSTGCGWWCSIAVQHQMVSLLLSLTDSNPSVRAEIAAESSESSRWGSGNWRERDCVWTVCSRGGGEATCFASTGASSSIAAVSFRRLSTTQRSGASSDSARAKDSDKAPPE